MFDVQKAFAAGKDAFKKVSAKPGFTEWTPEGTAGITNWINEVGAFPTRNFKTSFSDHYEEINGKAILKKLKITDKGCYCCPTPCGKYGHTKTKLGDAYVEGPRVRNHRPVRWQLPNSRPSKKSPMPITCATNWG